MRILFSAPPQTGHLLPALPALLALRAAGHDVLIAGYGGNPGAYDLTGLPVVDVGDGMTVDQAYAALPTGGRFAPAADQSPDGIVRRPAAANAILSRPTIDPLRDVVRDWRPQVLVYDPFQGAVPLVAAEAGIPAVEHQFGPMSGRALSRLLAAELAGDYRTAGPAPAVSIDITPSSLSTPDALGWPARYVPVHGPATLPRDLLRPGRRPRVLVTFGTIVGTAERDRRLGALLPLLARTDAEFLLPAAHGAELGALPANVRPLSWAPVSEVLRHCRAVIHHGGAGTMMSAVATGTPQLIVPHHGDQFFNADLATRTGIGMRADTTEQISEASLEQLLHDERLAASASAVQEENAGRPAPATLVARFEELVRR